jgi:hypothetical protein
MIIRYQVLPCIKNCVPEVSRQEVLRFIHVAGLAVQLCIPSAENRVTLVLYGNMYEQFSMIMLMAMFGPPMGNR